MSKNKVYYILRGKESIQRTPNGSSLGKMESTRTFIFYFIHFSAIEHLTSETHLNRATAINRSVCFFLVYFIF